MIFAITRKRIAKAITSGVLTLCLVAGSVPLTGTAYAASSFTSKTPFDGTYYGKGDSDNTYTHNAEFSGDLIANGIDVSYWQEKGSDWVKAKADGVDFTILRVSYTSLSNPFRTYEDTHFKTHYNKARKAGVDLIGVYAYSQAKSENEAAAEARFAIKRLKELGIGPEDLELPVYMDYEFGGGRLHSSISMAAATKCAKAFCEVVRNAGYKPGIYASTSFYNSYINIGSLGSDVDIWCAQYYYKNTLSPVFSKWQYSSTASINGITSTSTGKTGGTDVDFWYIDRTKNPSSSFRIYGNTYLKYTGKPITPVFDIYYGDKLLKEGEDYTVCGIANIGKETSKATAYAYVRGIGKYSGYAVVPFYIKSSYNNHVGLNNEACEDSEGIILSNRHIYEDITKYLVRFVDEEGKDLAEPAYYQDGTAGADVEVPEPVKEGFVFTGWLDEAGNPVDAIADVTMPVAYTAAFEPVPEEEPEEETPAETTTETEDSEVAADASEPAAEATETEDADAASDEEPAAEEPADEVLPAEITETVDTGKTYLDLEFGYTAAGSYVRNIPADTTAEELVDAVELRKGYEDYSLKVLTASYSNRTGTLKTGDMLCVYADGMLVGTADITVNGSTINDTGAVHLKKASAAKVTVAKTYVKKLKRYKKAFKVTVAEKSSAYVSGYQIRYSTKKSMAGAKTKTISTSSGRISKKITKLKSKKRYYVQARSYKIVNGKKYYSAWSKVKSVKTK